MVGRMSHNHTPHEAGADVLASSMRGEPMKQTFPRIHVRLNAAGRYDAYLIRSSFANEIWVSTGNTIAGALWWVPAPMVPRCCLAGA